MRRPTPRPRLEPLEDRTAPAAGDLLRSVANPVPTTGSQFGLSVAVSGNLMAVGAPFDDPGGVPDAGSVYLFNIATGALVATIPNPSPAAGDQFGLSVAVNEGRGVVWVGAPLDDPGGVVDSGTVYAFSTGGGAPVLTENNPSPAAGDQFGFSLGADSGGNFLAIGAPGDDFGAADAGRAYLATFTGGLFPGGTASNPAPAAGDRFGEAVAVTALGEMLVGAPFDDPAGLTDAGTAYLYDINAQAAVVTFNNPSPAAGDRFGNVVALGGNSFLAVITAPLDDPGGVPDAGTAYVFDANAGGETPGGVVATLTNPSPSPGDLFGATAAVYGFVAVVGAPLDDPGGISDAGTAYEFRATTGALLATLNNPAPSPGDQFGAVALQPTRVVVGALGEDAAGPDAGAAYVFDANLPPAVTNDAAVVPVGAGPTTVVTTGNDSSLPDVGETLTVAAVTQGANGGVVAIAPGGGSVTYAPPAGFRGTDTFTYTASDGNGGTATATVTVTVTAPSNPTPVAAVTGPPNPATGYQYGQAVAVSGGRTVVGSAGGGPVGVYDTDTGVLVHTLAPPAGASWAFGFSAAISFDTVVVGDIGAEAGGTPNAGAAYVFDLATGALRATLTAPTPLASSWFGHSVAVSGTTVVVGTYEDNSTTTSSGRPGRVYVYDAYSGSLTRTVTNPSPSVGEEGFGSAVALAGTTLVVGAPLDHVAANLALGQVYLYDLPTGNLLRTLNTPTLGSHSLFGQSVGVSAGRVVVGAREAAYVFDAATGARLATLGDPTPTVTDQFGHTVAISGTRVVVGAPGDDPAGATDAGAAYLFDAATGAYLRAVANPAPAAGDRFGAAVAISGTRVVAGAPGDDPAGVANAGAAFVFDVNFPPTARDDTATAAEDGGEVDIDALANDTSAPDGGEFLNYLSVTQPAHGTVVMGEAFLHYTPAPDYVGSDTFTYTVTDLNGGTATATVVVTVTPVNDPPAAAADALTVAEDGAATVVNVLANDSTAPDTGETLSVTAVSQPAFGTVTLVGGVVRYTPAPNYHGADSFTYTVSDGNGGTATATVAVTVTPVNDLPTAIDDVLVVGEDAPATVVAVLANDSAAPDAGETLTVTAVTQPAHGTVTLAGGVVSYTPAADFNGTDAFTYTVSDGNGGTTATVAVTVTPVNDPPTATGDDLTVAEDAPATVVPVLANDSVAPDAGETVTVTAVTQPAHGTVTLLGGVVRYTPVPNYHGSDSFTYTLSDGHGGTATATVTVTVTPVNDPPTAVDDVLVVGEDAPATAADVRFNDSTVPEPGETLTVTAVTQPAHGTVALVGGVVSYAPAADYNGPDSFTYTISDGNGGTATATVAVTVFAANDPPTATADTLTVAEDDPATVVPVLANDSAAPDTGETLTVTAVTQPAHGTVTLVGGVVQYTPAADYSGADAFTYTVSDGNGGTATATVAVTVTPVNDPPTPAPDTLTVAEDAPATAVPVLANDSAAPDTGETLGVVSATQPAHGVVTLAGGVVTYTPAADYSGPDFFTYAVSDGASVTVVSVAVTVTPVNDPPTARGDAFSVAFNAPATTLVVLANDDTAPDAGETLTVTAVTQPAAGGAVAVAPGGTGVTFTPAAGFSGTATFTYTVGDGTPGGTATATVTVTVGGPPSFGPVRPVAVGGSADGTVRLTSADGTTTTTVAPFGNTGTPTRTASADVDGDGVADVVAVTGPGTALQLAVLSGKDGSVLVAPFDPFGGGFAGGGYVAAADLDGDGRAEFVVTPDQGGGPRVTIFGLTPGGAPTTLANFFGIDDPNFRGGARGAVGDVDGDGTPDLIVAAGFGGGPRVAIFSGQSVAAGAPARLVNDFFAFPGDDATSLRNGAFVAAGDVTGDGFSDLIFGGGPGGAPRVFILSGALVSAGDVAGAQASPVANFFVGGNLSDRGGARVGVTNADGDDRADLVVGSGAGQPARVRLYLGKTITGGGEPAGAIDLDPPGGGALTDGVYVG